MDIIPLRSLSRTSDHSDTTVAGPEFYNRSLLSRNVAMLGLFVSTAFSIACIAGSSAMFLSNNGMSAGHMVVVPFNDGWTRESFTLGLNLLVAACTESAGFVHNISLRSALAFKGRLEFNTNLRLLTGAGNSIFSPNAALCNCLMIRKPAPRAQLPVSVDLDAQDEEDHWRYRTSLASASE